MKNTLPITMLLVASVSVGIGFGPTAVQAKLFNKKAKVEQKSPEAGKTVKTPSGLQYQDLVVGNGAMPHQGQKVIVHYTGWLTNGQKFDSSVDRGQPFDFTLGAGDVIKGWDEGVATMRVGGKRKLTIPPQLAYGQRGQGPIPPNSVLVFDVQLLGVK